MGNQETWGDGIVLYFDCGGGALEFIELYAFTTCRLLLRNSNIYQWYSNILLYSNAK